MTQDPGSDDRRLAGPSQVPADDDRAWMPPGSSSGPPSYGEPPYPAPAYPGSPYPAPAPPAGYPYLPPPPLPPILPRGIPRLRPVRIDPVPGTPYGIAIPALNPTFSGLAVGSMVAGIGSILVSLAVLCAGISQASAGALVGGAFAVLTVAVGLGAIGAAVVAMRQIRGSGGQVTGRGLAIAGLTCGSVGTGLALIGMLMAVALAP